MSHFVDILAPDKSVFSIRSGYTRNSQIQPICDTLYNKKFRSLHEGTEGELATSTGRRSETQKGG